MLQILFWIDKFKKQNGTKCELLLATSVLDILPVYYRQIWALTIERKFIHIMMFYFFYCLCVTSAGLYGQVSSYIPDKIHERVPWLWEEPDKIHERVRDFERKPCFFPRDARSWLCLMFLCMRVSSSRLIMLKC